MPKAKAVPGGNTHRQRTVTGGNRIARNGCGRTGGFISCRGGQKGTGRTAGQGKHKTGRDVDQGKGGKAGLNPDHATELPNLHSLPSLNDLGVKREKRRTNEEVTLSKESCKPRGVPHKAQKNPFRKCGSSKTRYGRRTKRGGDRKPPPMKGTRLTEKVGVLSYGSNH